MEDNRSTARQVLRRFSLGSGPLKRTSDRFQFLARVLLAGSLVMAIPVALVAASVTHAGALTEATAQAQERHQVDAELAADPRAASMESGDVARISRAPAVWPGPSGTEHVGLVVVPADAKAGSTVPIWIDRDGDLSARPLTRADAAARAVGTAMGTYVLIAVLAGGVYLVFRAGLDRTRLRRWGAEWSAIEPVWTRTAP